MTIEANSFPQQCTWPYLNCARKLIQLLSARELPSWWFHEEQQHSRWWHLRGHIRIPAGNSNCWLLRLAMNHHQRPIPALGPWGLETVHVYTKHCAVLVSIHWLIPLFPFDQPGLGSNYLQGMPPIPHMCSGWYDHITHFHYSCTKLQFQNSAKCAIYKP